MHKLFKEILVPVDFTVNTEVAIYKTLQICDTETISIHLYHILKSSVSNIGFRETSLLKKQKEALVKLKVWKQRIEEYLPNAKVLYEIRENNSIEKGIIAKALEIAPDLIVIGKKSTHSWLPFLNNVVPTLVSRKTQCSVLTVKPGSLHNKIRNILMPVNENIPWHKMDIIASICQRNRVRIFLVTFVNEENIPEKFSATSLLKVYQWLKSSINCQAEYAVLHGRNKAKALLHFAEKNNADILLLNSDSVTKIGWPGKYISDAIPPESRVQVLLVHQPL